MNAASPMSSSDSVAAKLYREGKYNAAFQEYLRSATEGNVHAQMFLGWMYKAGCGTEKNEEESLRWYRAAAEHGYPLAQELLGVFYYQRGNYVQALEWYEKAAVQGYMSALWRLGRMYKKGRGTPIDKEKAYALFQQAAKQGHTFSKRDLAMLLIQGHRGIRGFFTGVRLFAESIFDLIRIARKSESDERIRH